MHIGGAPDGVDPFEPIAHGHFRIRKRADGACGFLSANDRCRIHEELGGEAKPLACRVFPFRFHAVAGHHLQKGMMMPLCPIVFLFAFLPVAAC